MKLVRLACAVGVVVVSGGCAERLTAPPEMAADHAAPAPRSLAQPLFVLDGRVLENGVAVEQIDPNRIENIEVLKGAAAVERFGPRAANGVVLITLKQPG
jgi:TonB-dependent SusC/RagA subfamily outer membrane receptor